MLSTKNYYGNPNLLKKVRIRTITANQMDEFNKVVTNSFVNESESNSHINYNENNSIANLNSITGW
ncbi:MAG: hypothetical protein J0M18_09435 [Ignavibacteria bacterium]|nr:hypothetical protein [Ignavibacteria bacterium]